MMKAAQVGAPPPGLGLPPGSPPNNNQMLHGGGSSSGSQHSPSGYQGGPTQAHSPTPSSTPVSELSPGLSPTGTPWDVKQPPQQSWDVKVGYPTAGRSPDGGSCDVKPHQQSWDPRVGYGMACCLTSLGKRIYKNFEDKITPPVWKCTTNCCKFYSYYLE
ncbi:unnamed protein product [Leptidea sinapis]|uniref:Uncharacterized protein n=1 Tax=Leptidea sinapis TaxID=189913 RepID=A0A5E4R3L1_9NEOP|nr:unnamed protein product [Leptidea sinapis]